MAHITLAHNTLICYNSSVIVSFGDKASESIFNEDNSKDARRVPMNVWPAAARKLDMVNAAYSLSDLTSPTGNRLERLKGRLSDFYSIRVNNQFRIVFKWSSGNAEEVMIMDYHK